MYLLNTPQRSLLALDRLVADLEHFYARHRRLPRWSKSWTKADAAERAEHKLRRRLETLQSRVYFCFEWPESIVLRLARLQITKREPARLRAYRDLITQLRAFGEFHGTPPTSARQATAYEKKLYYAWRRLESGQDYREYYVSRDRAALQALGYEVPKQIRYRTLITQLLDFARTHPSPNPRLMAKRPSQPELLAEYRLANRLRKLRLGLTYREYLNVADMELLASAGIDIFTEE